MSMERSPLSCSNHGRRCLWILFALAALARFSFGVTIPGTLSDVETTTIYHNPDGCTITTRSYTWKFTDTSGIAHPFPGESVFITTSGSERWCLTGPQISPLTAWSTDRLYYLQGATGSATEESVTAASGYINPKYVILGVTYAPPGPSSYVDYTNSNLVANETDLSSSFSSGYSITITVSASGGILGYESGGVTGTSTTSYTQQSNTSSSVTVSKTTTTSDKISGPTNGYVGLNHDYDVIWLWLNPVTNFVATAGSTDIQWTGFGYSTLDQPGMDVYPVYVGWLNGDIAVPSTVQSVLARSWAAGEVWPSGQGPGLTSTDYQTIEASDPYWDCTPKPSACPTTVSGTRFTGPLSGGDFVYQQAAVGGNPITQTYSEEYQNTTTQGQGATYTFQQIFAIEETFKGGWLIGELQASLKEQSTLTWMTQWNNKITDANSSTAMLSITGPPCVVSGDACNPVYTGPTEFDVYQDNLYGTFLFFPLN